MHYLLCILATLSLASAIPLPQYDDLTDIVASNPLDTNTLSTNTYSPDSPYSPLLLSENWSNPGVDQSWTGKDREPSDRTGMGPPPKDIPGQGVSWPATPGRDGSHAGSFNPKPPAQNDEAAPTPIYVTPGGEGGGIPPIFNGIIDPQPNGI